MPATECKTVNIITKKKIEESMSEHHKNGYFLELEKRAKALSDMKRIKLRATDNIYGIVFIYP